MSYAELLERVQSNDFLAYQGLLLLTCYIGFMSILVRRSRIARSDGSSPFWLTLSTILVIISTSILPALYRLLPVDTLILPWECESAYLYYFGLSLKQSASEYARACVQTNPGVLSASGQSLMYGIPTYFLLGKIGWSVFTLRAVAYLFGLLSLIPGYFLTNRLFNANVAMIFVMIVAANTHTIFYMGYGVSSTATLCGLLIALSITVAAVQAQWYHRYLLALIAPPALFAACFNYSPARIFIVITLACLALYAIAALWRWRVRGQSGLVALMIVAGTLGLFAWERQINPGADFASARGEQAFVLMQHKEQIVAYLGDTQEVRTIDPTNMPMRMKLQFLLSVIKARLPEFVRLYDPLQHIKGVYPEGSLDGTAMSPYPLGLIIPLLVGFLATLLTLRSLRSFFIMTLLSGTIAALLLTTRFDTHRSYILIIPVSMMIAYGLWIPMSRLRGGFFREAHVALLSLALATGLIAQSWFFMAKRDYQHRNVWEYARAAERLVESGTTIAMALECNARALVALSIGDAVRTTSATNLTLWDPGLGEHLLDSQFTPTSEAYQRFLEDASRGRGVLLYSAPISLLLNDLQSKSFEIKNSWDGTVGTLIITPRPQRS